jgi:hypothetical protein
MLWAAIPVTEAEALLLMQELPDRAVLPMRDQGLMLILKQKGNQAQVLPE